MYQNSPFWKRLIANCLDLLTTLGFIILIWFLIYRNHEHKSDYVLFYLPFVFAFIYIIFYYLFLSWILGAKTPFQYLLGLKIIGKNNQKPSYWSFLKRNIFNSLYWVFVMIVIISLFYVSDYTFTEQGVVFVNKNSFKIKIGVQLTSILIGFWPILQIANNMMVVLSVKRLNLTDRFSNTRLVVDKIIEQVQVNDIKLEPYFNKLPEFKYISEKE
ncbi:RDD family protein [Mycoplasmopsis sturni]|uniref:RDD family protein n=1 Tax=Mycoplasmopsis sturni TaxID=39047 RepID=UPI000562EA27|nr:RDD family protein [Mycoplasmopsis sturni]